MPHAAVGTRLPLRTPAPQQRVCRTASTPHARSRRARARCCLDNTTAGDRQATSAALRWQRAPAEQSRALQSAGSALQSARRRPRAAQPEAAPAVSPSAVACVLLSAAAALSFPDAAAAALHAEPANALSLPTWVIHVASVAEWVIAMDLVWKYGDATGRPEWKGLTWGMLPLHGSSLCACTYHFFYNPPALNLLVTLQAGLTCFGNATLCVAAWRLAVRYADLPPAELRDALPRITDGDLEFAAKTAVGSVALAAAIKYGSLAIDAPFEPSLPLALGIVGLGTAATAAVFAVRSTAEPAPR